MFQRRRDDVLENWDLFVLRHQNMNNVLVHFLSFLMFWLGPLLGFFVNPWYWLLFFLSGMVGTAGHFIFKDGTVDAREATSSFQVVLFSSKMAKLFIFGEYKNEILRVIKKWEKYKNGELPSLADSELFNKLAKGT